MPCFYQQAILLLACVFLAVGLSFAEEKKHFKSAWYFSVGAGSTYLEPEGESAGFSAPGNSSSGTKFGFGQKLSQRWGWELDLVDTGVAELNNANPALEAIIPDAEIDYSITAAFAHYYFNADSARFNFFAKAGVSSLSTSVNDSRIILNNDSPTQAAFGLGLDYRFSENWFTRFEYDNYSKDARYTGLSLAYRFGGSARSSSEARPRLEKALSTVIEYPIYAPQQQVAILAEDQATVNEVANEILVLSEELVVASRLKRSKHLANQAGILKQAGKRIAIVEESILRTTGVDLATIDLETFVSADGDKLLVTSAEQSVELSLARNEIQGVEQAVGDLPYVRERLSRVQGRVGVIEESLSSIPQVIEYPIYVPEQQVTVLAEDRAAVAEVADEILRLSEELVVASRLQRSKKLAKQANILTQAAKRIAIVEESILRTRDVDLASINPDTFVNEQGDKLLITPAEQSIELGVVREEIKGVKQAVGDLPAVQERLSRVQGRVGVIEESLLFIPPWEEEEAAALCQDFAIQEQRIQFASDSARLTRGARNVLNDIANKMNRNFRVVMEVHAHTDSWGTFAHNQQLSERRAEATVSYLAELGVTKARLLAQGFGETKPIAKNTFQPGRAKNRRVELLIKNPNICQ